MRAMTDSTLVDKVWERHLVRQAEGEPDLLYIDLHLVHEVTSPQAFDGLRMAGRGVRRPDLTVATMDHNVPTTSSTSRSRTRSRPGRWRCWRPIAREFGIRLFRMGDAHQGIVHIIGPELGLTQPGMTIVCGDSHTSTHGAFGALAFGIGTSEVEHVLATQTLPQRRPKTMAVTVDGALPAGVSPKDLVLAIIGQIGTGRRHGSRHRVPRCGHPGAHHGRPHDGVQHVHRGGRPGRDGRARTTRRSPTSKARPFAPHRTGVGSGARRLALPGHRRGRPFRPEVNIDGGHA